MTSHFTTPNALRSHLLPSSVPIPIRFAFFGSNSKVYLRNPPTKIFSGVSATTIASCHLLLCISPCTASLKEVIEEGGWFEFYGFCGFLVRVEYQSNHSA